MVVETHGYIHRRGRVGLFVCECGCGQEFFADYTTRHPKYANKTHRARAYRARARARAYMANYIWSSPMLLAEAWNAMYQGVLRQELEANRGRL